MKFTLKKLLCGILAAGLLVGTCAMTACNNESIGDPTKTQLWVFNYDGGWGRSWLDSIKTDFEEKYANVPFEEGKTGVEVQVFMDKVDITQSLRGDTNHVYFTGDVNYNDLAANKLIMSIDDIVTQDTLAEVSDGAETGKIVDKIPVAQREALTAYDGKYYSLPFVDNTCGITYDCDLFETKSYYLKGKDDGSWIGTSATDTGKTYFTNKKSEMTVGPNGIRGDYDDGLPATIEEFKALVARIASTGDAPFIWSGRNAWYATFLGYAVWANLAGIDEAMLSFNYGTGSGEGITMEYVSGFNGDTPQFKTSTVTPATGYLTHKSKAMYYASDLMHYVFSNNDFRAQKWSTVNTHLMTQREYIYSNLTGSDQAIAMLLEGNWWYNEATDSKSFEDSLKYGGSLDRNFKFMPMPVKVSGGVKENEGKKPTLSSMGTFSCFINNNITNPGIVKAAKEFIKFVYTDKNLSTVQEKCGGKPSVNFTLPAEKYNNLNTFAKSYADMTAVSDIVVTASAAPIFVNNSQEMMNPRTWLFNATVNNVVCGPLDAFKTYRYSTKQYFIGLDKTDIWNKYSEWF